MVAHHAKTKMAAETRARRMRAKGYCCSVSKLKKGYLVSVRRE